jgi:hypothetical protein
MMDDDLKTLSNNDLVERFRAYALEEVVALLDSDIPRVTTLYWKKDAIDNELRSRGPEARRALLTLLDDESLRVRLEAARRLLVDNPEKALQAIKDVVASHQMPEAGDAGMLLLELERDTGQSK